MNGTRNSQLTMGRFWVRLALLGFFSSGTLAFPGRAAGIPPEYEVRLAVAGGGWISRGEGMNASGHIAGWTSGYPSRPWIWTDGTIAVLPTLSVTSGYGGHLAYAINDLGQAVGSSLNADGNTHACLWKDGVVTDLGTFGGKTSVASDISNAGQIVGWAGTANGGSRAFLWEDGHMSDLGTLGGSWSEAVAINAKGQVVGKAMDNAGIYRAFLWEDGTMTDLEALGGYWSRALDINDLGDIVGFADNAAGVSRPCLWRQGVATELTLNDRDWCMAINNLGQIVGFDDGAGYPFLYEDGVKHNLKAYTGWDLSAAYDINDSGQILVQGGAFSRTVFLLTPIPEPATLSLLAVGALAAFQRRRRRHRFAPGTELERRTALVSRRCVLGLLALAAAGGAAVAQGNFAPAQAYVAQWDPIGIAAADFNNDGLVDLAAACKRDGYVTVYNAQPGGGFGSRQDYYFSSSAAGSEPVHIATGDFNEDHLTDMAVAVRYGNIAVMLGQATGGFGPITSYPSIGSKLFIEDVVAADFDRDGHLDLAGGSRGVNTFVVLYGAGNGTFTSKQFPALQCPYGMAAGDFNGDGWMDLATANRESYVVSVLYNAHGRDFGPRVDCPVGQWPEDLVAADIDGDNVLDLVVTLGGTWTTNVLYGRPGGGFDPANYPAGGCEARVADFNLDGKPDIALTGASADLVKVIYGQGNRMFDLGTTFPTGEWPAGILAADLNGDGKPDLATADFRGPSISVLYNTIPEPATLSLLALGGVAMMKRRKRG